MLDDYIAAFFGWAGATMLAAYLCRVFARIITRDFWVVRKRRRL